MLTLPHRLAGGLVAVLLMVPAVAGCGTGDPAGRAGSPPPPSPSPGAAYSVDPTGRIACSTDPLPRRFTGQRTWHAQLDGVTAELTADVTRQDYWQFFRRPTLTLSSAGGEAWRVPVRPADHAWKDRVLSFGVVVADRRPAYLCLVRFAGADTPLAVVTVNGGGAHCCTQFRFYDAASRTETEYWGGNFAGTVIPAGGRPLLSVHDERFVYRFTAFAGSGAPIQLVRPTGTGFVDVTRDHPDLIRADADRLYGYVEEADRWLARAGMLAAWAADEEMLGNDAQVRQVLADLNGERLLGRDRGGDWPGGDHYIAALRSFLADKGYLG